jgi:hypothetical protein
MTGRDTHKDKMMLKGKLGRLSNDANIKWWKESFYMSVENEAEIMFQMEKGL